MASVTPAAPIERAARALARGAFVLAVALTWPRAVAAQAAVQPPEVVGSIERLDAALDELLAPGAKIEKVAGGFTFIEGPVWTGSGDQGRLLFSDIQGNTVYRWSERDGVGVLLEPVMAPDADTGASGGSNGLVLDPEGRLVLCEHGNRRVSRLEADGSRTVLADRFEGRRLNSPNDGVFARDGSLYFTDPPYGLPGQDQDPAKELDWNGIYRLRPDGTLELLSRAQTRPNGIGFSPDQRTLYVANSAQAPLKLWMAYPVEGDGALGEGRVFHDASGAPDRGVPDGLTVDRHGNLWATGPGGVWVLAPDGRHLGTVRTPELPANAGWGDDGRTLYITARTGLYRIRTLSGAGGAPSRQPR